MQKKLSMIALATLASLVACKKEDSTSTTTKPPTTTSSASSPTPTYSSGDGAIVALLTRTTTTYMGIKTDMEIGTGVAVFGNLSTGTYTDAGKVSLNDNELSKQTNNSYVFMPTTTNPMGIDLSTSSINWSVGTPAFTYDAGASGSGGKGMPYADAISGTYTSINTSSDFTLEVDGFVSNSDSVYFQITGASGYQLKRMGPNTTSVTFTAAEMKSIGATTAGSVVICPWNHQLKTLGGKSIHVINELALSRVVEIK